jgi:hypothetical protein
MPLTEKGKKIMNSMKREYGSQKGKQVFYASRNKGTIGGVERHGIERGVKPPVRASGVQSLTKALAAKMK